MTLDDPDQRVGVSAGILAETEKHLTESVLALSALIDGLQTENPKKAKDVADQAAEVRRWARLAAEERSRVQIQQKRDAGIVHDYALDFAAARDEVGRRMALLRAAAGAGDLSE